MSCNGLSYVNLCLGMCDHLFWKIKGYFKLEIVA